MATLTGGRIVSLEAKRDKVEPPKGRDINVSIRDVAVNKEELTVQFDFVAVYHEAVGSIKVSALMHAKEDAKKAKDIVKEWKEKKQLPDDFSEMLMNYALYVGGIGGTFVAQLFGLDAPIVLMPVKIGKGPVSVPPGAPMPGQTEKAA